MSEYMNYRKILIEKAKIYHVWHHKRVRAIEKIKLWDAVHGEHCWDVDKYGFLVQQYKGRKA